MKNTTQKIIDEFFFEKGKLAFLKDNIVSAINVLTECAKSGKILVCGNGGSAADSEHISGEMLKSFRIKRNISDGLNKQLELFGETGKYISNNLEGGIKCIPLTSFTSAITAFGNDKKEDLSLSQLVNALGDKGDALIAISTSGNAKNVYYAAVTAKAKGIKVIALTGKDGGILKNISDITIVSPERETYLIQETHLPVYHLICAAVENEIFGK